MIDMNASAAALRAGYGKAAASGQLMARPRIRAAIEQKMQALQVRSEITVDRVIQELARIGFADIRKMFKADGQLLQPHEMPDDVAAAVSSIEAVTVQAGKGAVEHVTKIKTWDKRAALVDLGKHLGMFVERKDVTIHVDHMTPDEIERELAALDAAERDGDTLH